MIAVIDSGTRSGRLGADDVSTPPMLEAVLASGIDIGAYCYYPINTSLLPDHGSVEFQRFEARRKRIAAPSYETWAKMLRTEKGITHVLLTETERDDDLTDPGAWGEVLGTLTKRGIRVCIMPQGTTAPFYGKTWAFLEYLNRQKVNIFRVSWWYPLRGAFKAAKDFIVSREFGDITSVSLTCDSRFDGRFLMRVNPILDLIRYLIGEIHIADVGVDVRHCPVIVMTATHDNGACGIYTFDSNAHREKTLITLRASSGKQVRLNINNKTLQCELFSTATDRSVVRQDRCDAAVHFLQGWLKTNDATDPLIPRLNDGMKTHHLVDILRDTQAPFDDRFKKVPLLIGRRRSSSKLLLTFYRTEWGGYTLERKDAVTIDTQKDKHSAKERTDDVSTEYTNQYIARFYRERVGLSRAATAKVCGVSEMTIWRWEQLESWKELPIAAGKVPSWISTPGGNAPPLPDAEETYKKLLFILPELLDNLDIFLLKELIETMCPKAPHSWSTISDELRLKVETACHKHNLSTVLLFRGLSDMAAPPPPETGLALIDDGLES